ncbi:hypothetical protein [Nocardia sp. CDC160]|uniref:hypothetical protein n=1 Tax=Nocardia sp. CDC160 TaxID=3112166 RepID=UPI002DB8521C|nr:hypothetical protein [Nocardia sp. CDC160]MEC3913476.1 hypothetical protein [Nocardia sp. CDC160]
MSISFRPTDVDRAKLTKLAHPGESQSDVLRRALDALDQLDWERDAQAAASAIMASGENLNDEPDAW